MWFVTIHANSRLHYIKKKKKNLSQDYCLLMKRREQMTERLMYPCQWLNVNKESKL